MKWRIYYGDGSTYSNEDGPPENAPGVGVQVIVRRDRDHGRHTIAGGNQGRRDDFFWWDATTGQWFNGDHYGFTLYLMRPGWRKVIFGESIGNEAFLEVKKRAAADPDFPRQTGWHKHEVR